MWLSEFLILVLACIGAVVATNQEDDYYLKKLLPKLQQLETNLKQLDAKDEYRVRRFKNDVRVAAGMFAKTEKASPSYSKAKTRLEELQKAVAELNKPKPEPKLAISFEEMNTKYGGRYGGGKLKSMKTMMGSLTPDRTKEIRSYFESVAKIKKDANKEIPLMEKHPEKFKYQLRQATYLLKDANEGSKRTIDRMVQPMKGTLQQLKICSEVDMSNDNHVRNRLSERIQKHVAKQLEVAEPMLELALEAENLLGTNHGSAEVLASFRKYKPLYDAKIALVAGGKLTKLPKDIGNPELAEIASEVLKNKKYGVKGWKKLVVNSKKRSKERTTYEVDDNVIIKTVRKWDEYQVTTVEEMDGKLYLHFNTIAYFHRGATTTPTGKWILSQRFKGSEISPENAGLKTK